MIDIVHQSQCTAVKALIYREDGCILMQQRDDHPGIPFPNAWNLFGGMLEEGESPNQALVRELREELGSVPGEVEPALFSWKGERDGIVSVCYPMHCQIAVNDLTLMEGQAMRWFTVAELVYLNLTPMVYHMFSAMLRHLGSLCCDLILEVEKALLDRNNLAKKNERVFYAKGTPCSMSIQQIILLKELAKSRGLNIFRVCLHPRHQCEIHEMIMMHTKATLVGPHKQMKCSLSYHAIDGEAVVELHDDQGKPTDQFRISSDVDGNRSLRLNASVFRSIRSLSDYCIFLEVASGPFKDSDTVWLKELEVSHEKV